MILNKADKLYFDKSSTIFNAVNMLLGFNPHLGWAPKQAHLAPKKSQNGLSCLY